MNSSQIRKALSVFIPHTFETGVYACDELFEISTSSFAVVFNSDKASLPGTHWLALFKHSGSSIIEWFDSFSLPLDFYCSDVRNFVVSNSTHVRFCTQQFQSTFSDVCGDFCLYFLANRVLGFSYEDIVNTFSLTNMVKNDELVRNFVQCNVFSETSDKRKLRENVFQRSCQNCKKYSRQ